MPHGRRPEYASGAGKVGERRLNRREEFVGTTSRRGSFVVPDHDQAMEPFRHLARNRAERAIKWIERYCTVPSGRGQGKRYKLRRHHRRAIRRALSDPDTLAAVISAPRGWGKSGLLAPLLVWALFDQEGAQVVSAASSMRTAMIPMARAMRIVELEPALREHCLLFYNAAAPQVEIPHRGAQLFPVPADARNIVGLSPTFVLVDELSMVASRDVYDILVSSLGKAEGGILVAIGTPGLTGTQDSTGQANVMWELRQAVASDEPPPGLVYIEWSADPADDPADPKTWKRANPSVGDLLDPKVYAMDLATLPAHRFAQLRLGLWTQSELAWLPKDQLDALGRHDLEAPEPATTVALGFDGSVSGDSTALVAVDLATTELHVLGHWERPEGDRDWRVPRRDVRNAITDSFERYNVVSLYADPWWWRSTLDELAEELGEDRVILYNTAYSGKMAPAADHFRTLVRQGHLVLPRHDRLEQHLLSARAKATIAGDVLVKDAKDPQLIDLAVAAVLACEAGRLAEQVQVEVF